MVIQHLINTLPGQQLTQNGKFVWQGNWEYFTRLSFTNNGTKQMFNILQNKVCLMLRIVWWSPWPERAQHWLHEVAQTSYILLKSVLMLTFYFLNENNNCLQQPCTKISTISYESLILRFSRQNILCLVIKYISLSKWRLNH